MYNVRQRWGFLAVLFMVSVSQFFDRNVIAVLLEPIKREFNISDAMLGLLGGFSFALFYAGAGIPVARWADRGNRRTVIVVSLVIWSCMTMLCGLAQTFWQLVLARVGVGAGESGGLPPSQSLIVDYFPPERRATAIAIFTGGAIAGSVLGLGLGGYIAALHGWRSALSVGGAAGLVLALIVRFAVAEPRLHQDSRSVTAQTENWSDTLTALRRKRSYVYALAGSSFYFLFAYGALIFVPSFMIRVLRAPLVEVSVDYGAATAAGSFVGTLGGGWLADRLSRHDIRWLAWLPAVAFGLAAPIFFAALALQHFWMFIGLAFVFYTTLCAGIPSVFTAVHAVCGNARRATAIAIVYFSANLLGGGFGPLLSGALSDALSAVYGAQGLRYALMLMTVLLLGSGILLYHFGRAMPRDLEE